MKLATIRQRYIPPGATERMLEQAPVEHRMDDLEIAHAFIIYAGTDACPMEKRVTARSAFRIADLSAVVAGKRAA